MKMKKKYLTLAVGLAISATAQADLARMGPVNPTNGYPTYYQDINGLALDLCIPNAQELVDGACLLFPADIPNPNAAISFPGNFPEEAFWWNATAVAPLGTGRALLVMALEAAFAGGPVLINDQIVFSRIRYKFIAPVDGQYTVETPYSVDTFEATAGELVFNTSDIGINCPPGDFSCAMKGKTAPFLRASTSRGGAPSAFVTLPGGGTFLADPAVDTFVTGGTMGNVFRITGPGGTILAETDQFSLMGRVHTAPLPRATTIDRVTYARSSTSSQVDAFVTSLAAINAPTPSFQLVAKDLPGVRFSQDTNAASKFRAQVSPSVPSVLPVNVSIIDTTDATPVVHTAELTDLVEIKKAKFDGSTLNVEASSSDETAPPTLTVTGSNGRVYGTFTTNSSGSGSANFPTNTAPESVIVTSSAGGRATLPVSTAAIAIPNTVFAENDLNPANLGAINVLANDTGVGTNPIVRIVKKPDYGTVTVSNNIVSYTPIGTYNGPDNFTYYIDNGGTNGISNIASVDFTVTAVNRAPVANADTASVTVGSSVTIDVIANDTDLDNDTLSITAGSLSSTPSPTQATISNNKIVFTAPTGTTLGTTTFTYTVNDGHGGSATGNVTVNVLSTEVLAVTKAQYTISKRTWQVDGADTPAPGGSVGVSLRIYAGPATVLTSGALEANESKFIGQTTTSPTDATGRFRFSATASVIPVGTTFHIKTSRGKIQNFTHTISN